MNDQFHLNSDGLIDRLDGSIIRIDDDDVTIELPTLQCAIIVKRDEISCEVRDGAPVRLTATGDGVVIDTRPLIPPTPEELTYLQELVDSIK